MNTNKLLSRSLCLLGTLFLVLSSSLQAVQTVNHDISFSTTDDKMFKDSAGLGDSFSYTVIKEDMPGKQTFGEIETWTVDNPLWDDWEALLKACIALKWSESECRNGVETPNPAYWTVWLPAYELCRAIPRTRDECIDGYTVLGVPVPGLGDPPPRYTTELVKLPPEPDKTIGVDNGAQVTFSNAHLLGGFEGSYTLGDGSVNATYAASTQISAPSVINAGELVTLSTSKLSSSSPTLLTDLSSELQMELGAFSRIAAKVHLKAVQLGITSVDETFLDLDTGVLHQEVASFRIGGDEEQLEVKVLGEDFFDFTVPGVDVNIPLPLMVLPPAYNKIIGFPMADVALYMPELRTPPHTEIDSLNPDKVLNSQLPVTRRDVCTIDSCPDGTVVDFGKVDLDLDVTTVVAGYFTTGIPYPLGATGGIPLLAKVELNVLDADIGSFFGIAQDMSLTVNNVVVKFIFSQAVEVETSPGVFTLLSEHAVNLGDDLVFRHPGGPLSATPVYMLTDNAFYNKTYMIRQFVETTNYLQVKATGLLFEGQNDGSGVPIDWSVLKTTSPLSPDPVPFHTMFEDTYPLEGFNSVSVAAINLDPNLVPVVELSGSDVADEGQVKTYTFTVADADEGDTFTVSEGYPDCGTGGDLVIDSIAVSESGGSFQCLFPDGPATPVVGIQVADSRLAVSEVATKAVTVNNVMPVMSMNPELLGVMPGKPLEEVRILASDVPDDPLIVKTSWKKDDGPFTDGLPDEGMYPSGLSLDKVEPGAWTISGDADLIKPHNYTIRVIVDDGDGGSVQMYLIILAGTSLDPVPELTGIGHGVLVLVLLVTGLVGLRRFA